MKPLAEAKMKSLDSRMDFRSWTEISDWGYSRIPIYQSLGNDQDTDTTYSDFNIKIIGFLHVFVSLEYEIPGSSPDVFVGFNICDYRRNNNVETTSATQTTSHKRGLSTLGSPTSFPSTFILSYHTKKNKPRLILIATIS